MNKSELIVAVAAKTGLPRVTAAKAVNAIFSTSDGVIAEALAAGDRVQVTGFGAFECRHRGARMGRNPRTGESIPIAASKSPAFRPGRGLRGAIN